MRLRLIVTAAALTAAGWSEAADPQLRIISFTSTGQLTWTNFAAAGAYRVEWASSPKGPWNAFASETNLNLVLASTNRITVQAPVSNQSAYYRVAWTSPRALGVWDYYGSNSQGGLFATGQLNFASGQLISTNPWRPYWNMAGTWNFQCAGAPTEWCVYPAIGSGWLDAVLDVSYTHLRAEWPSNVIDGNMVMDGTIWGNTWTGRWYYSAIAPSPIRGTFLARKR